MARPASPQSDFQAAVLEELAARIRAGSVVSDLEHYADSMPVYGYDGSRQRLPLFTELRVRYSEIHRPNVCNLVNCECEARHQ